MNDDFHKAVANMRRWQKEYFKTRNPQALNESKKWEREVDRLLADEEQQSLFQ